MKGKILKAIKLFRKMALGHGVINYKNQGKLNFIDVGALGDLPEPWFTNSKFVNKLLSFEPLEGASQKENIITSDSALWETEATLPFYIYKGLDGSGSSLFKQNYEYVEEHYNELKQLGNPWLAETWFERSHLAETKEINCTTLDGVLAELQLSFSFDFLKIDAQGAEYQILKGGEKFLKESCLGLQLELFNIPLYKDIKLLTEVEEYLNDKGFDLVKKFPAHGSFDSQHDCVFLKRDTKQSTSEKMALIRNVYNL